MVPNLDDYYIDIGARSGAEAQALVSLGDCAVFASDWVEFGQGMVKAKALDDRAGCAVLLKLLEEELPMDCTFVFTAQEEVGTRGAFGAAFSVKPEIALVLETTTAAICPAWRGIKKVCVPGAGAVIPFMDKGSIADRGLFELLRALAEEHQIPWQTKHWISGGKPYAAAFQRTREGVRTAAVSLAVRYLHAAPASVAAKRDLDAILHLTRLFIGAVADRA